MNVELLRALVTQLFRGVIYDALIVVVSLYSSACIAVYMPEIETGVKPFIGGTEVYNLFHRAYLIEFAHRFGAKYEIETHVPQRIHHRRNIVLCTGDGVFSLRFSARRGVKHGALTTEHIFRNKRLPYVTHGLFYHVRIGICKICIIRSVRTYLNVALGKRRRNFRRRFFAYSYAASERILIRIESHSREPCRRFLGALMPLLVKGKRISARSYSQHMSVHSLSFCILATSSSAFANLRTGRR